MLTARPILEAFSTVAKSSPSYTNVIASKVFGSVDVSGQKLNDRADGGCRLVKANNAQASPAFRSRWSRKDHNRMIRSVPLQLRQRTNP